MMKRWKHDLALHLVKILHVILISVPYGLCWYGYYAERMYLPFYNKGNWAIVALFVILYVTFARVYEALLISLRRVSELVYSQCLAILLSDGVLFLVTCLLARELPNPLPALATLVLQVLLAVVWSLLANKWYFAFFPPKRSVIIYDRREILEKRFDQYELEKKFRIERVLQAEECLRDLTQLESAEAVFLSGIRSHERNILLKYCVEQDIQAYVLPSVGDVLMSGAKRVHMFHLAMLQVGRYHPSPVYLFCKRVFDIVVSGIAMILFSPVFLGTAIAIKLTDRGPVIYKQERLTKDGRVFWLHKFRSMRVDAEKDGVARLSSGENDDRITPVGRRIRKYRIDELPQLWDVFVGALSIVGPRPERPQIAEEYYRVMPEFRLRLQAKAGLTGYAQVYGKYNTPPGEKLRMDLMYIAKPSLMEDLRICFATVKILFMPESTEGIQEGATTAMDPEQTEERPTAGDNGHG